MRLTPCAGLLLVCVAALVAACTGETRPYFSKAFFYTFAHDGPTIILGMVSSDGSNLSGTFDFENISGERKQAKHAVIRGVRRLGGFWAHAHCEARRDENSSWEALGQSWVFGWPANLNVKAESAAPAEFSVRLDIFDSAIGRYKFGRIVLSSGDTSQFALEDLTFQGQQSSNQTIQLTASKPAVHASRICRRELMFRIMHRGRAAAGLVSR